jgi:hypothetical protein
MNPKKASDGPNGRPEVIVEFLFERGLLSIAVRNIGNRDARNIRISFDKKLVGADGKKEISGLAVFQRLEFLGPQRQISCFVDESSSYFRHQQPTNISVEIEYRDADGRKYQDKIKHNLEIYRELPYVPQRLAEGKE